MEGEKKQRTHPSEINISDAQNLNIVPPEWESERERERERESVEQYDKVCQSNQRRDVGSIRSPGWNGAAVQLMSASSPSRRPCEWRRRPQIRSLKTRVASPDSFALVNLRMWVRSAWFRRTRICQWFMMDNIHFGLLWWSVLRPVTLVSKNVASSRLRRQELFSASCDGFLHCRRRRFPNRKLCWRVSRSYVCLSNVRPFF